MPLERVGIETHLGVEADQLAVLVDDERIDLEEAHVLLDERAVEVGDERAQLLLQVAAQAERFRDAPYVMRTDVRHRVDGDGDDLLRRVVRDLLDVHPAFGGDDDRDPRALPVDEHRQVEFLVDRRAVLDVEAVHLLAGGAGLMRDQRPSEHLARELLHLGGGLRDAHAALLARVLLLERSLAAAAGMDLRLHHPDGTAEFGRCLLRLRDAHRRRTF